MGSEKQKKQRKGKKTKRKVLSVAGALALGATLPSVASASSTTVADRISRIRDVFAKGQAATSVPEVKVVRSDAVEKKLIAKNFANFTDFMNYFANFKDFTDFKDFHDFTNFKDFLNFVKFSGAK